MSSDRTGAVGEAAATAETANGAATAHSGSADRAVADEAQLADPWFAPGPKVDARDDDAWDVAEPGTSAGSAAAAGATGAHAARQAEWFLRTGRAGLLPDSMMVASDDDAAAEPVAHHGARITAAGAPPWAGEKADASASEPPPWETGPWPGPGGLSSAESGTPGDADAAAAGIAAPGAAAGGAAGRYAGPGGASLAAEGRWPARAVVTAGVLPLVVPGLVIGILSLRQPGGRSARKASWLAIGASVAWAVIIILVVVGTSGGAAPGCGGYPAAVVQAYDKALTDVRGHAPVPVEAADLGTAADRANASAAAAGQLGVRTALFAMANDMAQARADIVARRPVPSVLRQHLAQDGVAPACAG